MHITEAATTTPALITLPLPTWFFMPLVGSFCQNSIRFIQFAFLSKTQQNVRHNYCVKHFVVCCKIFSYVCDAALLTVSFYMSVCL